MCSTSMRQLVFSAMRRSPHCQKWEVVGFDNLNAYYDPSLKEARLARLKEREGFRFLKADLGVRTVAGRAVGQQRARQVQEVQVGGGDQRPAAEGLRGGEHPQHAEVQHQPQRGVALRQQRDQHRQANRDRAEHRVEHPATDRDQGQEDERGHEHHGPQGPLLWG